MRSPRRALLAAALSLAAFLPQPAGAFDGPGCGGSWSGSRNCSFRFDGSPLAVYGWTTSGSIRVWVTLAGSPEVVLLECADPGSCENDIRAEDPLQEYLGGPLPPQTHGYVPRFQCWVQGQGNGEYFCGSGEGAQPS
ncbi:MAG TPA: hypothetical protein VGB52_08450 [Actinomycetota bacterium]